MEHLDFILWMCLWPITWAIDAFLYVKKLKLLGEKYPSKTERGIFAMIVLATYIYFAIALYPKA